MLSKIVMSCVVAFSIPKLYLSPRQIPIDFTLPGCPNGACELLLSWDLGIHMFEGSQYAVLPIRALPSSLLVTLFQTRS